MKQKRILVTGGAGFLGSHLCEKLLDNENQVICLDNLFTGNKKNIQNLFNNPNFEFIRHDITQPISLEVDQIYNLACPASPVHYQFDPVKTVRTNVMGMINCLDIAKSTKARILQASTSEVYGNPSVHPQTEDYWGNVNPIGIRSCYDEGKRVAECLMMDYHRQYKVDVRIVRIFNTYGPRMSEHDGRVVSNFIVQALAQQDITIYGNGNQTRSFCYVDDLVDGLILMMERGDSKNFTGPINLGNPKEFTMLELAKLVIDMTKSRSTIVFKSLPKDDPERRKPDITMAKKLLGWQPRIELERGLWETIRYFRGW